MFRDVRERPIAIVPVEMGRGFLARGPFRVESCSVREVNVKPAVLVVIEECEPAAFGFNDVALVIGASPNVGDRQSGLLRDIDKLYRRIRGCRFSGKGKATILLPQRSAEGVEQGTAENQ